MSTGKRLAKRSIIGTRVTVRGEDGFFYSGVIHAVRSEAGRYCVRFDPDPSAPPFKRDYRDSELIGPGFRTTAGVTLLPRQKVFITFNGREVSGRVLLHEPPPKDEVTITITPQGSENPIEVKKRLEDVRLVESRKSARLLDQDTDYSRLADMAGDRRRLSTTIDVPPQITSSRKRRPSSSQDEGKEDLMDECTAALVLMHLSCSPHSPNAGWVEQLSPCPSLNDGSYLPRSATPSPPLSDAGPSWISSASDEGIVLDDDFDELPKKKKAATRTVFLCRWPGCQVMTTTCPAIEQHVRNVHLGPRNDEEGDEDMEGDDHEEEFYYTELEVGYTSPPPSQVVAQVQVQQHQQQMQQQLHLQQQQQQQQQQHQTSIIQQQLPQQSLQMPQPQQYHRIIIPANRPPHEDHEYHRALASPVSIPAKTAASSFSWPVSAAVSPSGKQMKLSVSAPSGSKSPAGGGGPGSPSRRVRGDTKKCRKVYGMEHRELWCTQCKWKKACTRFGD